VSAGPRKEGPVVLDMAMSQFSYGKIETYKREEKSLPYDAGFDEKGNLTRDPSIIIENELSLPAGLWKGAGLSLVLDLIASTLSNGKSTVEIGKHEVEFGLSQFFLALNPEKLGVSHSAEQHINRVIEDLKSSSSFNSASVRYPGENTIVKRNHHLKHGVPVARDVWEKILAYQK
jgi:3-dehydro-L-gulonate 2-dehydrogenase